MTLVCQQAGQVPHGLVCSIARASSGVDNFMVGNKRRKALIQRLVKTGIWHEK